MPPTLTFPIVALPGQSPVRKRVPLVLELRTRRGLWVAVNFRLDTGAELCLVPLALAAPRTPANPVGRDLATDTTVRRVARTLADGRTELVDLQFGTFTARFPHLPRFVFTWECVFDPALAPTATALLGIGGRVLSDVALALCGPSREHPACALAVAVLVSPVPLFPPAV